MPIKKLFCGKFFTQPLEEEEVGNLVVHIMIFNFQQIRRKNRFPVNRLRDIVSCKHF